MATLPRWQVAIGLLVLAGLLYLICKTFGSKIKEAFTGTTSSTSTPTTAPTLPRDLSPDQRTEVSTFLQSYIQETGHVCDLQTTVLTAMAQSELGVSSATPDLATAQATAEKMALGPLIDCGRFTDHQADWAKSSLTLTELYTLMGEIPADIGTRLIRSITFSKTQLQSTLTQIQGALTVPTVIPGSSSSSESFVGKRNNWSASRSITDGFADVIQSSSTPTTSTKTCPSSADDLCPDEMVADIIQESSACSTSLTSAQQQSLDTLVQSAQALQIQLQGLKDSATAGTLHPIISAPQPPPPVPTSP